MAIANVLQLEAAWCRVSRSWLFWPNLYYACAQTAISQLPIKILTLPLDLATPTSYIAGIFWQSEDIYCVTLTFNPFTLNMCHMLRFRLRLFSQSLNSVHLSLCDLWLYCWYVTSRCDLDLWPLDLERLNCIGRHVMKLSTKFERNCTIRGCYNDLKIVHLWTSVRGRVIDHSANFSGSFISGRYPTLSSHGWLGRTTPDLQVHRAIIVAPNAYFSAQICSSVSEETALKATAVKMGYTLNFALFHPVKITGGWTGQNSVSHYFKYIA